MTTTNPVPSNDPTDLLFNAQKLDQVVNGSAQYYTDRLGVNRRTMEGISAAADVVLGGLGYAPPVTYASGISLTLTTQTVEYSGEIYAPKVASLPFTTSTWATDSAKFRLIQGVAATDLAASGGAGMIGYMPEGTDAVATTVQKKLRERVSVFDLMTAEQIADVTAKTNSIDITAAVNIAISAAAVMGKRLLVPAGLYKVVPATAKVDEAGINLCAFPMTSRMHIDAEPGAVFRIADNVSTDAAPVRMSMFFSNQVLSDISIRGLTMDMNGQNNKISPNRATLSYNRFTNAAIIFSGTPGGVAASGTDVTVKECVIRNAAGVSCIVMAQSNTPGVALGKRWKIVDNRFENVGLDTDDHSCVFGWATDVEVHDNIFINPAPWDNTTKTGGLCAYEIHGSNQKFYCNTIVNFYQGLWISTNLTEIQVRNLNVFGNKATVSCLFTDFWSGNGTIGATSEAPIQHVSVHDNEIEITNDAVADTVKAFFKVGARQQPALVRIHDNICRSFDTTKNVVLALLSVNPNQLVQGDQISICDNTAAGIVAGAVFFFGGNGPGAAANFGSVEVANNRLGVLLASPGGLYQNKDVVLYGISAGVVNALRVYGLEQALPISKDGAAGGRATVYGKAILDLPVTWNGVTIGNGTKTNRVSLDTDAGFVAVSARLIAGSTSAATGAIYPVIQGVVADTNGTATATHFKPGASIALPSAIDVGSSRVSLFGSTGGQFGPTEFSTSSVISVQAQLPCLYAAI